MEREYFTKQEAADKTGRRIRTKIQFAGVPKSTTGRVLQPNDELVSLPIQWDLPGRLFGTHKKPLVDWFSKRDYESYLEEI